MAGELIVEQDGHVVRLTLNRPAQRNAVTPELIEEALEAFDRIDADAETRVVVLTGAGTAFCAGFDINRIDSAEALPGPPALLLPRPSAASAGRGEGERRRLGHGLRPRGPCDLRIASEAARFQMPPAKLGVLYETGGMARLVQTVGPAFARELLLCGEPVRRRGLRDGLVNRLVPAERLDEETSACSRPLPPTLRSPWPPRSSP